MLSVARYLHVYWGGMGGDSFSQQPRVLPDLGGRTLRRRPPARIGWALFTTTPLGTSNWYYEEIWQKTQDDDADDYRGVKFHTDDNTAVPGLAEEVEKARKELPDAVFRRNYKADFHAFKGQIYTEFFDEPPHVVDECARSSFVRRIGGIDWGWSNPGVLLEIGVDMQGRWWVYDEHYQTDMLKTPPEGKSEAGTWLGVFRAAESRGVQTFWADPSEPETIATFEQNDIPIYAADNEVRPGIDVLKVLMHDGPSGPRLRIHERCQRLRRELGSYKWKDNEEKPVKEDDHGPDALRYAAFSEHSDDSGDTVWDNLL